MKCNLLNFLLFLIVIYHITFLTATNLKKEDTDPTKVIKADKQKLIQCKLCQEMFDLDFNYEAMLKSSKLELIKKTFEPLQETKDEMKGYFSNENMQFITKEISMQYFFKGGETQIDELNSLKIKNCKKTRTEDCDIIKLDVCEKILSYENGTCVNIKNYFKELLRNLKNKSEVALSLTKDKQANLIKNNSNKLLKFKNYFFKEKEEGTLPAPHLIADKDPEIIKQFGDISLLQLTPEYIQQNFDSVPKSHWKPPKPVLLSNFQGSIGDQLKDISALASEISHLEQKLKVLKQQLANKLEVAQSSYSVVQKTLTEISKMINQPNLSTGIKSPSSFTEDDWDESAKPRFVK